MSTFNPHTYQQDGIDWELSHNGSGLFLPPGLGKTSITLKAIEILIGCGEIHKVIIVAPLRVCYMVWRQESEKFNFGFSIGLLHGPKKDEVLKAKHDIYLINPENLQWLYNNQGSLLSKYKFKLVCDESTLFKNHSSLRFKVLKSMLRYFKRRVILTGTPSPNGLLQLWPQVYILDEGKRLGKFITHFRRKYFMPNFNGYGYTMMNGADKMIYAAVDDILLHKSSDELDLPELMFNTITIKLPDKAAKLYKEIKDDFIATFGSDESLITAMNSASQSSKLKQIANGSLYSESGVLDVHSEKMTVCDELIETLGGRPLLIVYEYNHDLARLKERYNAPHIGGGVSGPELEKIIKKWNKGELPVLLLQPQAGGHGLNLQDGGCHDVVWYSITFDLELYDQVNKRVHRQGVKNSVTIHHIVAENTVDQKVIKALANKSNIQSALLESLLK